MRPAEGATPARPVVMGVVALLLLASTAMGCLDDGNDEENLDDWYVAMTVERFDANGLHPVNVTELLFKVRFGNVSKDTWMIQESNGFIKGPADSIPVRVEARYDDGKNPVEEFPILGQSNVVTAALIVKDGKLRLQVDGDASLYKVDQSIDRYPHDKELTARFEGLYGNLTLYFGMNLPT